MGVKYYIEDKNGDLVSLADNGFKSLTKAREIARYFVKSPRYNIKICGSDGYNWTEGEVGLSKDYKTYFYMDRQGYKFFLKKDGTLGKALN